MTSPASPLTVPARFCGPPRSGNGGWTAGALADRLPGGLGTTVRVTLRRPPPLDVPLDVTHESGGLALLLLDGARVAEAEVVNEEPEPVEPVEFAEARNAESRFLGWEGHPFPTCFTCGPDRAPGDGLRLFPGEVAPVGGTRRVAAAWVPDPAFADRSDLGDQTSRVDLPTTWAALDCTGGWAGDLAGRRMVLGRMTAQVDALPVVGDEHVVVGRLLGTEGRKTETASTLYDADERIVARARHTWIEVDPATFGQDA